jgi:hypothetical protein
MIRVPDLFLMPARYRPKYETQASSLFVRPGDALLAGRPGRARLRECERAVSGAVAVDLSLQNGRTLEHHHATGNRNLDARLEITARWKLASG